MLQGSLISYILVLLPLVLFFNTNPQVVVDAYSDPPSQPPTSSSHSNIARNYLVYMSETPPQYPNPKDYYIKVLSSILGSEKAAKDAIIYAYGVISGFSAKLSPDQASLLKDQPGIVYVTREIKYRPEA